MSDQPDKHRQDAREDAHDCEADGGGGWGARPGVDKLLKDESGQGEEGGGDAGNERGEKAGGKETPETSAAEQRRGKVKTV